MSDIEEFTKATVTSAIQQESPVKLKPLYRQFTGKLAALLLTTIVVVASITVFFYQSNIQNKALIADQLLPLTQQFKQVKALQQADKLTTELLNSDNAANFVDLHAKLISTNQQLLSLESAQSPVFKQWINDNKLLEDIVSRIQGSDTRNQQLKQSSIIQLQLMLFSLTTIIDKNIAHQKLLDEQLQAGKATFARITDYYKTIQQLNELQQLHVSLTAILASFNDLNIYTPMANFESLRVSVEMIFSQNKQFGMINPLEVAGNIDQQVSAFEKIVLTEQRALAKWQGYIRLAQEYQLGLKSQQQTIKDLLIAPYKPQQINDHNVLNHLLSQFDVLISNKQISFILLLFIGAALLVFCYLLWSLAQQIKKSAQQSVEIIYRSLNTQEESNAVVGNCSETQEIIECLLNTVKPKHSEQEFQTLVTQYKASQDQFTQQQQTLKDLTESHQQQQLNLQIQISNHFSSELQRYRYLESLTLSIVYQQQAAAFTATGVSEYNFSSAATTMLHQKLTQFQLALEVSIEKSVLTFNDVNFIDELHTVLLNQQQAQQKQKNQLFIRYDEQLFQEAKIDLRLFQQLFNILIDITLDKCSSSQWHLDVQLKDKRAGQQRVSFVVNVTGQSLNDLPCLITQLLATEVETKAHSPFIYLFSTLFVKQHGENIVAQLVDGGYQLSFELPLAIASSANKTEPPNLEHTKLMLLSNNTILSKTIEKAVFSAKGECEKITRIDSFQQQLTVKHLNRRKLNVVVVTSEMALEHLDLINKQINELPDSLKPKLMILQSSELNYERFGFYSQAEHIFCKDNFLLNLQTLQASDDSNNQLIPRELFIEKQYVNTELPLLLAVKFPQQYQNLQRLLHWLGFQVDIISDEATQHTLWKTGQYSLLVTEFADTALVEMTNKPFMHIAVFSLTSVIPRIENGSYFNDLHIGKLDKNSSLSVLVDALSTWLKPLPLVEVKDKTSEKPHHTITIETPKKNVSKKIGDSVITEAYQEVIENKREVAFDFPQYLQHQGSVELALFMLDDYALENHQQLDSLINAIKEKDVEAAKSCIAEIALNAKILSAKKLQLLCVTWSKIFEGEDIPSSLKKVNALLNETRIALSEIDEYAEAI